MSTRPSRYERTRCVRLGWKFERAGWVAMAVVTIAAIAGLLGGPGVFSEAQAASGVDFTLSYVRFGRAHAPQELSVEWLPGDAAARLWIARPYLDAVEIRQVSPAPDSEEVGPDRVYYTFRAREPGLPVRVRFTLEPVRAGGAEGRVGIDDGREVSFRQFVFP